MAFNIESIKQGFKREGRDEHPENKNIHVFQDKNFTENNPLITKFSKLEQERGYKKIFFSDNEEGHAEAFILLNKKTQDGKNIIVYFTQTEHKLNNKEIDALGGNFLLIGNKLDKGPLSSSGCVEYATSVLQNFDGNVLLKTENGLEKTNINKVKDGQEFITEQQVKLYQSRDLLKQFEIDPKEFKVTDSIGRKVALSEYSEKYTLEVPVKKTTYGPYYVDPQDLTYKRDSNTVIGNKPTNKHLNLFTTNGRSGEGFQPPRIHSGKDIERFQKIAEKGNSGYLNDFFPGDLSEKMAEKNKNIPAEYDTELQKRADQLKQKNIQETIPQKPSLNREKLKPNTLNNQPSAKANTLNSLSNAALNIEKHKEVPNKSNKVPSVGTKLPAINNQRLATTSRTTLPNIHNRAR